jgi:hypothetical protein
MKYIIEQKQDNFEYFGPGGMGMGSKEGSTMKNFIVYTVHPIYSG